MKHDGPRHVGRRGAGHGYGVPLGEVDPVLVRSLVAVGRSGGAARRRARVGEPRGLPLDGHVGARRGVPSKFHGRSRRRVDRHVVASGPLTHEAAPGDREVAGLRQEGDGRSEVLISRAAIARRSGCDRVELARRLERGLEVVDTYRLVARERGERVDTYRRCEVLCAHGLASSKLSHRRPSQLSPR